MSFKASKWEEEQQLVLSDAGKGFWRAEALTPSLMC